ncbi:MAG: phosphate ABC transporter permease PstA [Firmicutes bacterium]|nr:phosphate ABC transporter permease PstA [Bacillota bacterium]MDD4263527.1 phosphate ABC transporter permease PstA [Bacillota bacterium]MDD4694683.1 phosphate ABC transporter permease PstA [Bacillota bacterium]
MQDSLSGKKVRLANILGYGFIYLCSLGILAMTAFFVIYTFYKGINGISLSFLTLAPNPIKQTIGIFPSMVNTIYVIIFSLLISTPIGISSAIYLTEYAENKKVIQLIEFTIETLAGIPSIIFGVFGYMFFCMALNLKVSLLSGVLTLTIMVLPTIIRTTQEALKAVPKSYKEGSLGIGATNWTMIRTILLPNSLHGIITSIILSTGRIIGESAALLLVAGGSALYMPYTNVFKQLSSSGSTLAVELFRYAYTRGDNDVGFSIALVLMLIVLALNLLTNFISRKLNRGGIK